MNKRSYTYYDFTISLCPVCLKRIDAKIVFENSSVYMKKKCSEHGTWNVLLSTDIEYYKFSRNFMKQSEMPYKFKTSVLHGCPEDCGLCTDHEQHSCLAILEITDRCNLTCPTCYTASSPKSGRHRTLKEIENMLDTIIESEKEPDVVQISGGEPTIHPDFFKILDMVKKRPIRHIMLNTNGIKIANDILFAKKLSEYAPGFEIYLQFDSLNPNTLVQLRGENLLEVRQKAIANLNECNLSTTLVITLEKNLNDSEIGKLIEYALQQRSVRGITFQPIQFAGRNENHSLQNSKITLSEIRKEIITQSNLFTENDIIPVPCNPDALAMGYALKQNGAVIPLTRYFNPMDLLLNSNNSITIEKDERIKEHLLKIFSAANSVETQEENFQSLLCCLPKVQVPNLKYENLFRIIIMSFMDAYDFDVRSVKKSCVHIATLDNRIIPFETMNLIYRSSIQINKK